MECQIIVVFLDFWLKPTVETRNGVLHDLLKMSLDEALKS